MTLTDHELSFSNPGPSTLRVWLEPWAEEFEVPALSTIALHPSREDGTCPLGELEWAEDHLIIWASAQKVAVSIDGVAQHSGSAIIPIPEGLSKAMLGVLFADQPTARLGGTDYIVIERPPLVDATEASFGSAALSCWPAGDVRFPNLPDIEPLRSSPQNQT